MNSNIHSYFMGFIVAVCCLTSIVSNGQSDNTTVQDEDDNQARFLENAVNACIGVFIGAFGRCNGTPQTSEERQELVDFCETTQREQSLGDFSANPVCAQAIVASNSCVSTVPCEELSASISLPLQLRPGFPGTEAAPANPNIPINLTCSSVIRTTAEVCNGVSFAPIFDDQSQIIAFRVEEQDTSSEENSIEE